MMTRRVSVLLVWLVIAVSACVLASAEGTGQKPIYSPVTGTWTFALDPDRQYPYNDLGGQLRIRYRDGQNVRKLGKGSAPHRRFFRIRARLRGDRRFSAATRVFVQIVNESFFFLKGEAYESKFNEMVFGDLFFEYSHRGSNPFGLRIGRQNLSYGDGFVIQDGTPLDGSRTVYANGVLLTFPVNGRAVDIFVVWNREKDDLLPVINNQENRLLEFNEFVGAVYARSPGVDRGPERYTFDYYYIYKQEKASERQAAIHTFGARLDLPLSIGRLSAELTYQGGKAPESRFVIADSSLAGPQRVSAYGAQVRARVRPSKRVPLDITGGYVHLSGDDPLTRNKFEGWNPVMGRWPKWSALYVCTLAMESKIQPMGQGPAYWQNFVAPYAGIVVSPRSWITIHARYMWMYADNGIPLDPQTLPSTGVDLPTDRGNLLFLKMTWKTRLMIPLSGHVQYEGFDPGGFYGPEAKRACFIRFELSAAL
jgi:hypothetical protein